MAKRIVTKIGDVFSVKLSDGMKWHFQYVAIDKTNMSSSVIRVFKKRYALNETPSIEEIVHGNVAFYASTILRSGIVYNAWEKIGNSKFIDNERTAEIIFGNDVGLHLPTDKESSITANLIWRIWKINEEAHYYKFPPQELLDEIEIGYIFQHTNILDRFERGYIPAKLSEYEVLKRKPWPDYNSYTKRELQGQMVYFHFLGEKLMREVVVADGKGKRFSADDKKRSFFGLKTAKAFPCDIEFADINWTYDNFITEEEFNNVWDGCRK